MRNFEFDRLPSFDANRAERDGGSQSSRQLAGNNESFQVLREVGIYLAAFLSIALAANVLLLVLAIPR